jgi:steroid delta-isomerase-like uncharacterized protein
MATESGRGTAMPPKILTPDPAENRNKAAMRRILDAFNTGDVTAVDEVASPKLVSHTPKLAIPQDREGLKQQITWMRTHFPDAHFEEEEMIAEGDIVYLRWKMTGTHKGRFLGREPSEKPITQYGTEVCRLQDGKIIEHRDMFDMMGFLDKLGLLDADMLSHLQSIGLRPYS